MSRIVLIVVTATLAVAPTAEAFRHHQPPCRIRITIPRTGGGASTTCPIGGLPVVRLYVNGAQLLTADVEGHQQDSAIFYGLHTVVRVTRSGHRYKLRAITLDRSARIRMQVSRD